MRKLDAPVLRSQLLTRAALALGAALSVALGGCAPPEPLLSPEDHEVAGRAIEYLRTTQDEMGVDVLMILRSFGELADDPRALEAAEARRGDLRASDVERYGVLLEVDTPMFPPGGLDGVSPPTGRPDPGAALDDRRVQTCVDAMIACEIPPECVDYALLDSWGYVLTHQAVWLLFAHWFDCELPVEVDTETQRHRYAARILAEARFDPQPSDLFFERLGVLGHLGFGSAIEPEWVDALRASQQPEGCFPVGDEVSCHPHPTALALWTLAHASGAGR